MSEDTHPNPYEPAKSQDDVDAKRQASPSVRWLAVPFFIFGSAIFSFFATFIVAAAFLSAGVFTEGVAAGFGSIGLIVGGIVGAIAGVGFARGTHLR